MKTPRETRGSRRVAALVAKYSAAQVGRKLALTSTAVRLIAVGARRPAASVRAKLARAFDVKTSSWDELAGEAEPATQALPPREAPGSTLALAEANVARLTSIAEAATLDAACSHRDRASASAALNAAIKALSRARGEEAITEARILKSPAWADIRDTIVEVTKNCLPCTEALAREFERQGREASGSVGAP
jgi:hypothetical protein